MQTKIKSQLLLLLFPLAIACSKRTEAPIVTPPVTTPDSQSGVVKGVVKNKKGGPIADAKITIEHTVWHGSYLLVSTSSAGTYQVSLPNDPAGDWTAKAQLIKSAYGETYKFDLYTDNTDAFNKASGAVRNFTWKLNGARPAQTGYYGAHVDLYQFGADVDMTKIKILFTPYPGEATLIDGTPATAFERAVEDIAGTYMVKDVPIGKYNIEAVYDGKKLLLNNRHEDDTNAKVKTVVFKKNSYPGETEYNIEFYVTE